MCECREASRCPPPVMSIGAGGGQHPPEQQGRQVDARQHKDLREDRARGARGKAQDMEPQAQPDPLPRASPPGTITTGEQPGARQNQRLPHTVAHGHARGWSPSVIAGPWLVARQPHKGQTPQPAERAAAAPGFPRPGLGSAAEPRPARGRAAESSSQAAWCGAAAEEPAGPRLSHSKEPSSSSGKRRFQRAPTCPASAARAWPPCCRGARVSIALCSAPQRISNPPKIFGERKDPGQGGVEA